METILATPACVDPATRTSRKNGKPPNMAMPLKTLRPRGLKNRKTRAAFRCHVVAYNEDGGYIDMELTPELKDVQCEACHGPGKNMLKP